MDDYNTASPEPELSPEDESLIADLFDFVDTYPPDHFIKVYPRRLRDFCRNVIAAARIKHQKKNIKITRAMIGALVLLGLRIDDKGYCYPGQEISAKQVGMRSPSGSRYIHRVMQKLEMIESDFTSDRRSRRYRLPGGIFIFGHDSYHDQKFARSYDQKFARSYDQKFAANKRPDSLTRNHNEIEQTDNAQSAARSEPNAEIGITKIQQSLYNDLINLGVGTKEAALIATQYKSKTISGAIQDARRLADTGKIHNPGAWVRRTIEKRANEPLLYNNAGTEPVRKLMHGSAPQSPPTESPTIPHTTPRGNGAQYDLAKALSRAGVRTLEACLIAMQYPSETIREAITSSSQKQPAKRGAWIRGYIEKSAGQTINYGMQTDALPLMQSMEELPQTNPYLIDPYDNESMDQKLRQAAQERAQLEAGAWETD